LFALALSGYAGFAGDRLVVTMGALGAELSNTEALSVTATAARM